MAEAIDSITASVVQGALQHIAIEMSYKLMRMSYSSIHSDRVKDVAKRNAPRPRLLVSYGFDLDHIATVAPSSK